MWQPGEATCRSQPSKTRLFAFARLLLDSSRDFVHRVGFGDFHGMAMFRRYLLAIVCVAGTSGCHPWYTRVPDLVPRSREQDRALWNYHDPFPDDTAGPSTDHRPAGARLQRTMPRQALEKDQITFPMLPVDPSRPQARLNPKTANVVQP